MDEDKKTLEETPEELKAEEETTKEVNVDKLRDTLVDELGIDPEKQADILDKLVEREKAKHKELLKAIEQKRSWREKAQKLPENPPKKSEEGKSQTKGQDAPDIDELVDKRLNERLEARDLESLDLPDEIKEEVKKIAKLSGISVSKAADDPYIKYKVEEQKKEQRILDATPKRGGRGSYQSNYDPSKPLNPDDFDMNTPEGVKAWREAKAAKDKYRAKN